MGDSCNAGGIASVPLDCGPNTTEAIGRMRSCEMGFGKGFPCCVYQEETMDLPLEEGPGLLFIHVSIIETVKGHFVDREYIMEGYCNNERVCDRSALSLKSPLWSGSNLSLCQL